MFWPADYSRAIQRMHRERPEPLRFLWGGHNLQTRFSHFGVREGDTVYPIFVSKKRLYLVGRMTVASIGDLGEYLAKNFRDREYVYHNCANEVLLGTHGSFLHFDVLVPREVLDRWRFHGNRGERPIKDLADGEIANSMTFQGTYRLSDATAGDLFSLLLEHEAKKQLNAVADS